jgi:hypothetical protein
LESKARYRATARSKEKEKATRKKYLATESGRAKMNVAKRQYYERMMASMTALERQEWNEKKRRASAALRAKIGDEAWLQRTRKSHLKSAYNLTVEDYELMREVGCMGRVLGAPGECSGTLCVDHNHECCPGRKTCGKCVRSLLCSLHNARLGFYEKHKRWSEAYIEMHNNRKEKAS